LGNLTSAFKKPSGNNGSLLRSPLQGRVMPLEQVPDEAFAGKVLGDGFAIEPTDGVVVSPVDGEVGQLFRTNHAIGLMTADGLEILIHVGIDTVKMNGEGFKAFVSVGQKVKAGDKLLEFDLALVKSKAKSTITPIVVTNMDAVASVETLASGNVARGQDVLRVKKKA
jgi:PTS system glucose-specific IIC component